MFQQTLEKYAGRKRAVLGMKSAEAPLILFTGTNDMLHNHLSDLTMQNLRRLFADLRFFFFKKVIVPRVDQVRAVLFGSSSPQTSIFMSVFIYTN